MTQKNARLIEKDIISNLIPAQAGDGETVDLFDGAGGTEKYSAQFIYTVGAFSPAVMASATNIFDKDDLTRPSQFLKTNHGLVTGLKVQIATSGTLPAPLVALTDYFVIRIDANYFQLAASLSNAIAGTPVALTSVGVGNQTVTAVALAGCSVKLQRSNDGVAWDDVASATNVTTSGNNFVIVANVAYRYVKAVKALTAGSVDVKCKFLAIGDSI